MDPTDLLDLAADRALAMCRDLAIEVAGVLPVAGGRLLAPHLLGTGGPCAVRLAPSDLFRTALLYRADQVIVVHNHVDGAGPSDADRRMTRRLRSLGVSLGVTLVGHLLVADGGAHEVE